MPATEAREIGLGELGVDGRTPLHRLSAGRKASDDRYSAAVMSIFMLNMTMGTGPMTLPYAFDKAGILLSAVFLLLLMVVSFMTTTFIVECMALANALKREKEKQVTDESEYPAESLQDEQPSNANGDGILERIEIGAIAEHAMPRTLVIFVYLILIVYTYGVLMVYCIAFSVSVSEQIGPISLGGHSKMDLQSCNLMSKSLPSPCLFSYYIVLAGFALCVFPLCLLNFQKTRPLQLTVGAFRIAVVSLMIAIMARFLTDESNETSRKWSDMPLWDFAGLPDLFGNAAFTFMVHHSIPGLVFPLRQRRSAWKSTAAAYGASYTIYMILGVLALWAFGDEEMPKCQNSAGRPCHIQELFNTNFSSADWQWAGRFIVLYPVLIVSVYPLVAITLRNNLRALVGSVCGFQHLSANGPNADSKWVNIMFTAVVVVPTIGVGFVTRDVQAVLKYIGGYAGLAVMFLIPCLMIMWARPKAQAAGIPNLLPSPFANRNGVWAILCVFAACIAFTTWRLIWGS